MSTYQDLLKKREELEKKIEVARQSEWTEAVGRARALVQEHGLIAADVFPPVRSARSGSASAKVAVKYKNPKTGATWTGRGKEPKWIQGQDRSLFHI